MELQFSHAIDDSTVRPTEFTISNQGGWMAQAIGFTTTRYNQVPQPSDVNDEYITLQFMPKQTVTHLNYQQGTLTTNSGEIISSQQVPVHVE